ncbi:MAG: dimethyl sulfoxide reductase anchor subunit [Burkholderiaceae bacterium]|nr:dimethyl sulfoxide reductase anchor subunit [Burkholderiaceae bacterium]
MRPELPVILLTTLIGAGQGLFLAVFTAQSYALFELVPAQDGARFHAPASLIALVLTGAGLLASFFHLGRPQRAWRAIAQWRTSWLSREVIALPAFMAAVLVYALAHWSGWRPALVTLADGVVIDLTFAAGVLASILAFALFLCTAMIYACLPFLREWHSPLTVINYTLLGAASGFTLATAIAAAAAPGLFAFFAAWALVITALAALGRGASLWRNRRLRPRSTVQTAIGVKHPRIVQRSKGFQAGSFNTREFFHGRAPGTLRWIRWVFVVAVFAVPALLLAASLATGSVAAALAAFPVQYAGLLAERWYFFAEANHPQNLYYQAIE